jgi:hypothetical protein
VEVIFTKGTSSFHSQRENYFAFHINFQEKCCIEEGLLQIALAGETRNSGDRLNNADLSRGILLNQREHSAA